MTKKNIVLVGFMGTGKTTVGKLLAEQAGLELVDMDSIIEQRAGKSISEIFANEGEPHFREMERTLATELSGRTGLVISTGGGIVLNPANIENFEQSGLTVCLLASAETVLDRVQHDDSRPLLAGDKMEKILALLEERRPLYEAVEHSILTDGLSPCEVADKIMKMYSAINS